MRQRRQLGVGLSLGLAIGMGLMCTSVLWAKDPSPKTTASTHGASTSETDLSQVQRKLDEVLANQQTILQKFDAVMEELRIIKVRATIRGSGS